MGNAMKDQENQSQADLVYFMVHGKRKGVRKSTRKQSRKQSRKKTQEINGTTDNTERS
jgi:hypothetical protein